jgi:hypothetical protein
MPTGDEERAHDRHLGLARSCYACKRCWVHVSAALRCNCLLAPGRAFPDLIADFIGSVVHHPAACLIHASCGQETSLIIPPLIKGLCPLVVPSHKHKLLRSPYSPSCNCARKSRPDHADAC